MAINSAAKAKAQRREERARQRHLLQERSQAGAAEITAVGSSRSPGAASVGRRDSSSDDDDDDDENGGGLMKYVIRTYFPPTYTERTSLADDWRRQEAERREAAVAEAAEATKRTAAQHNSIGWPRPLRAVQPRTPTVAELLEQQKAMAFEADVVERMRQQAEREHIKLLGRTPDVAGGRMDAILARARALTLGISADASGMGGGGGNGAAAGAPASLDISLRSNSMLVSEPDGRDDLTTP